MQDRARDYAARGWTRFGMDERLGEWVEAAAPLARAIHQDPEQQAVWLRCGGTWFAGVNVFPNDETGAVPAAGVPALDGEAVRFALGTLGLERIAWDAAQISVCHPGYPRPWEAESEANFRYRRDRDAAHVDGLLRDEARRRHVGETHAFILGIPLERAHPKAAPFVVWEGSHEVMRKAFAERLAGIAPEDWSAEDVTEIYVETRRHIFESCPRVEITAEPGEAYVVHRLALHGVAPWHAPETDDAARPIAYFRPDPFPGAPPGWWLERP